MVGTPEKALKDCLFKFEMAIKNVLIGLDYETAFLFMDIFSEKLDDMVKVSEYDIAHCKHRKNENSR